MAHRIMIVEDDAIIQYDLQMTLEDAGYDVVAAHDNAKDAVISASALTPDLILMDINIKGDETGIDAARSIRKTSKVAILFLTSHVDSRYVDEMNSIGPVGILSKPCRENLLLEKISGGINIRRDTT